MMLESSVSLQSPFGTFKGVQKATKTWGAPLPSEEPRKEATPVQVKARTQAEDAQWEDVAAFLSVEVLTVFSSKRTQGWAGRRGSQRSVCSSAMASSDLVDDLLQAYLAQYDHFPRTPEQLCTFAKNQGRPLRYSSARSAWSTGRASWEAARESRAASSHEGLSISTMPSLSSTASSSSTGRESTSDSQASSSEAQVTRPWLERYQEHYGHHPTSPQHLLAFVNNRGGSITYTTALRLMGPAGNVLPEPPPPRVTMRLERASATGPLPWWQDTLAINRHYRPAADAYDFHHFSHRVE
eukprot:symbB.v1.2.031149.t1/scaffold3584.1/size53777/5